ncbi:MAG: ATP-binding cassette domain-containing protein [Clostridia bacterium]|nr:ATP-binding cassette domain-containing protein [Clostridia bacterium]
MDTESRDTPLLRVDRLAQHFPVRGSRHKVVHAVDGVTFSIARGRTLGLVGESGCGKSTCARSIIRIYSPTAGKVELDGQDITHLREPELLPVRRRMQMIFQDPYSSLNARMTVRDLLAEPLQAHRVTASSGEEDELVREILEKVGLTQEHAGRYAHEFSGGQRQRVGVARALILRPELVICDEPVSALDVSIQAQIVNLLRDFQQELGLTYLFIAHDLSIVRYVSDEVGVMYMGKIVELSEASDIYTHPLHPYTQGLLSSIPAGNPKLARLKASAGLAGDIPSPVDLPGGCRFHPRCPCAAERCAREEPSLATVGPRHAVACFAVAG